MGKYRIVGTVPNSNRKNRRNKTKNKTYDSVGIVPIGEGENSIPLTHKYMTTRFLYFIYTITIRVEGLINKGWKYRRGIKMDNIGYTRQKMKTSKTKNTTQYVLDNTVRNQTQIM
jgi:hypothetical protein